MIGSGMFVLAHRRVQEQRQQMERLAQLPPTELEKLPAATKVGTLTYTDKIR